MKAESRAESTAESRAESRAESQQSGYTHYSIHSQSSEQRHYNEQFRYQQLASDALTELQEEGLATSHSQAYHDEESAYYDSGV